MTNPTSGLPENGEAPPFTIWALHCPFRKEGSPVLGNMGSSIRGVIVMEAETWKQLCEAHPSLKTQQFRVGTAD